MWLAIFAIAITFLFLDFIWIYIINKKNWDTQISSIQGTPAEYRPFAGIFVYAIMILSTWYFVVNNNIRHGKRELSDAIIPGALLGLAMYGVFDGTNHVMFKNYSTSLAIQDTIYGMVATTIAAIAGLTMANGM
jgi:uncharacterized membrane protein